MSKYLLDTDTCIFLLKGKFGVKENVKKAGVENCFVSEITLLELSYGASKSENYEEHIKDIDVVEELFGVVPIYECIKLFGKEKARLKRIGKSIPEFDLLIGVSSVEKGMTLVTGNEKHMSRIDGIMIENWIDRSINT